LVFHASPENISQSVNLDLLYWPQRVILDNNYFDRYYLFTRIHSSQSIPNLIIAYSHYKHYKRDDHDQKFVTFFEIQNLALLTIRAYLRVTMSISGKILRANRAHKITHMLDQV